MNYYIYPCAIWALLGGIGCFFVFLWHEKQHDCHFPMVNGIKYSIFVVYIVGSGVLLLKPQLGALGTYSFIPFSTIRAQFTGNLPPLGYDDAIKVGRMNLFFNLLVFAPFGLLLPMRYDKGKKWYTVFTITAVTAILVELIQYCVGRTADVDDVLLRVLGGMLGFCSYCVCNKTKALHSYQCEA